MSITFLFEFTKTKIKILIAYTKPYPICLPPRLEGAGEAFSH